MRFIITVVILISLFNISKAQSSFSGEYRMNQVIDDSLRYFITLKLNCNGTYVRTDSDSSQIAYGKWKIKNNDLVLSADSVFVNNKIEIVKYKLVYENIQNKYHIKSVSKKSFQEIVEATNKAFPGGVKFPKGAFKKYERDEKALYYEKVSVYNCN